jgi:hypothetical protein
MDKKLYQEVRLVNMSPAKPPAPAAKQLVPKKGQSGEALESLESIRAIGYVADDMLQNPPDDVVKLLARFAPQANKIRLLGRLTFAAACEQGRTLLSVRKEIGHGQFRIWLAFAFHDWSERHAEKLLSLARLVKSESGSDLERLQKRIDLSAFYMLAAPSMPPEVLETIIKLAEQGQHISKRTVRDINASLTPAAETNTVNERHRPALTRSKRSSPRSRTSAPESAQPQDEPAEPSDEASVIRPHMPSWQHQGDAKEQADTDLEEGPDDSPEPEDDVERHDRDYRARKNFARRLRYLDQALDRLAEAAHALPEDYRAPPAAALCGIMKKLQKLQEWLWPPPPNLARAVAVVEDAEAKDDVAR